MQLLKKYLTIFNFLWKCFHLSFILKQISMMEVPFSLPSLLLSPLKTLSFTIFHYPVHFLCYFCCRPFFFKSEIRIQLKRYKLTSSANNPFHASAANPIPKGFTIQYVIYFDYRSFTTQLEYFMINLSYSPIF